MCCTLIKADGKGIRFDVYVEDDQMVVYDIEMQTTSNRNLPKRMRYYQGMMDLNLIQRGKDYSILKKSYIIFICPFDVMRMGLHKYTFKSICMEDNSLILDDDTHKILLCADGNKNDVSEGMKDFLDYVNGKCPTTVFTKKLQDAVTNAKECKEWRTEYMTLLMRDNEMMNTGRKNEIFSCVQDGLFSPEIGAKRLNLSISEFEKEMEEAGYKIPTNV